MAFAYVVWLPGAGGATSGHVHKHVHIKNKLVPGYAFTCLAMFSSFLTAFHCMA